MHALIIEDEPLIAMLIEDALHARGYLTFDVAADQRSAVAAALEHCPDLITSDVRLAEGCGMAAVSEICRTRRIPVIFITATAWEVLDCGADAIVLHKPFASAELDRALAAVNRSGRRRRGETPN